MARIFITGSADGLGLLAAGALIAQGHQVVLHARNKERSKEALAKVPYAETVLIGDLANIEDTIQLAEKVNALGSFDAVIHNAGVYNSPAPELLAVNTLAPYILTCLIKKPKKLIYISSDMHESGHAKLEYFDKVIGKITYSDTKLHVLLLCKAVARKWPDVYVNALNPGWVPTKMGGRGAPEDLNKGYETQVWLAGSSDEKVKVSGNYFYHKKPVSYNPQADDVLLQERFLSTCDKITGISFS
ncbi:daunorubicin C-13 ketoreductase [Flavobacterium sp. WLB]|uniref:SDR family NAD(P)-dependent oxidoreductase n=1 Tax=Flavobacterium sp. WLB TaxID=2161662 RepID=UPI000D346958|nr:SDR family NAD(P)-dependent oxidoreductase [Flavobacterium sp. WLB]PUU71918.1 daunorubicin C-13 ketoreductase [Flavobacterium sp. WLB]